MRLHIDVLGLLHLVWGALGVLGGLSLAILAIGTHAALFAAGSIGRTELASVWLLAIMGLILASAGVAMMATGRGLRRRTGASRVAALVLAIPNLVLLPFGTALGVYVFWVLLNNDARDAFGRPLRDAPAGGA